uniref:Uncharacterized protein n=1 Tax=Globodera rostochiensis TaxID=31243 RepID=A0A914HPP0_GLORO
MEAGASKFVTCKKRRHNSTTIYLQSLALNRAALNRCVPVPEGQINLNSFAGVQLNFLMCRCHHVLIFVLISRGGDERVVTRRRALLGCYDNCGSAIADGTIADDNSGRDNCGRQLRFSPPTQ